MPVQLLTEHNLEFLSLQRGCIGSSGSTLVKIHIVGNFMLRFTFLFQALTAMVSRIRRFQFLNNQIFAVLNRYIPQSETVVEIKHFEPPSPIKESQEKQSDSTKETILIAQV